jgi:hypothetical protein
MKNGDNKSGRLDLMTVSKRKSSEAIEILVSDLTIGFIKPLILNGVLN